MVARKTTLMALLVFLLLTLVSEGVSAERRRSACRKGERLRVVDLDMWPDPILQGQSIRRWRVRIRLRGERPCETTLDIREGGNVLGRVHYFLRPGMNEINVRPDGRYQFRKKDHCFRVVVNLEGTKKKVDAGRRFCARQRPAWTLGERQDRR